MKYIGFKVEPMRGEPVIVVKKYKNKDKGVPLNHTWRLRDYLYQGFDVNLDITSFPASHRDYVNYIRRRFTPYARIVEELC